MKKLITMIILTLLLFPIISFAWDDANDAYRDGYRRGANPYYSPSQSPYSGNQQMDSSFDSGFRRGYDSRDRLDGTGESLLNPGYRNRHDNTNGPLLLNPSNKETLGNPGRRDRSDSTGRSLLP